MHGIVVVHAIGAALAPGAIEQVRRDPDAGLQVVRQVRFDAEHRRLGALVGPERRLVGAVEGEGGQHLERGQPRVPVGLAEHEGGRQAQLVAHAIGAQVHRPLAAVVAGREIDASQHAHAEERAEGGVVLRIERRRTEEAHACPELRIAEAGTLAARVGALDYLQPAHRHDGEGRELAASQVVGPRIAEHQEVRAGLRSRRGLAGIRPLVAALVDEERREGLQPPRRQLVDPRTVVLRLRLDREAERHERRGRPYPHARHQGMAAWPPPVFRW